MTQPCTTYRDELKAVARELRACRAVYRASSNPSARAAASTRIKELHRFGNLLMDVAASMRDNGLDIDTGYALRPAHVTQCAGPLAVSLAGNTAKEWRTR